eukprot:3021286-Amphidinium_carterae.1
MRRSYVSKDAIEDAFSMIAATTNTLQLSTHCAKQLGPGSSLDMYPPVGLGIQVRNFWALCVSLPQGLHTAMST